MTVKLTGKYRRMEESAVVQCAQCVQNFGCILSEKHDLVEIALWCFPTDCMNANGKKNWLLVMLETSVQSRQTSIASRTGDGVGIRGREWQFFKLQCGLTAGTFLLLAWIDL